MDLAKPSHPIARVLYHVRQFILSAPAGAVLSMDLFLSSLMTLYTFLYCRLLRQGPWLHEYGAYGLIVDFCVAAIVFQRAGVYKTMIRFTTMGDLLRLVVAIFISGLVMACIFIAAWPEYYKVHIGSMFINFMITSLALIGYRITCIGGRKWLENSNGNISISSLKAACKRVVIVGQLDLCVRKTEMIRQSESGQYEVVGYLTQEESADNRRIGDIPVRSIRHEADIDDAMVFFHATTMIFAGIDKDFDGKKLADICLEKGYQLLISHDHLSPFHEYSGLSVEEVQIEDLFSRKEMAIDKEHIGGGIRDMVVMVTGAAGSIGSELVRQICPFSPRRIIMLDHAETPLWLLRQEIERTFPNVPITASITNVSHRRQLDICMRQYRPDIIFHAAAYKHVPMMEENPCVAVVNNVKGTMHMATLAVKYRTKRFVMVSTDKAVNPTSVMGATKRLAEIYVQSLGEVAKREEGDHATAFVTTRFGNVLGSAGSVIPAFKEQIKRGGPVTVTHPDTVRFFMTIPEACRLILQANAMGHGGEVFVFDMGEQVKILDLAKKMIRLSGLAPIKDIAIEFTGLWPGEKLEEERLAGFEEAQPTAHERIRIFPSKQYDMATLKPALEQLVKLAESNNLEGTVRAMKALLPEYKSDNSPYQFYDSVETPAPLFQ